MHFEIHQVKRVEASNVGRIPLESDLPDNTKKEA